MVSLFIKNELIFQLKVTTLGSDLNAKTEEKILTNKT